MPTYEYRCKSCEHELEIFQRMSDSPKRKCPECGKNALERKIGLGAAVLFKGSGFYQTDYRSASYKKAADADKPAESKPADGKSESKGTEAAGSKTTATTKPEKRPTKGAGKPKDAA